MALFQWLALCLCALAVPANVFASEALSCRAACVLEAGTGRVLFSQNADKRMPMASTTKIMTALLVIEAGNLDKVVTVPQSVVGVEGSSLYLKEGEQFTRRDLLYAVMLVSGNDAAEALAIDVSGSVKAFVACMNERAASLGANSTHFANPHGLPSADHYTTAYDLAKITVAALKDPVFAQIARTKNTVIIPQIVGSRRTLQNKNKLLWQFDGAIGVKTGFTKAAGRCLVGAAHRDGKSVVAVVLNAPDMWDDISELMEDSLNRLGLRNIKTAGEKVGSVPVKDGVLPEACGILASDVTVCVTDEEASRLDIRVQWMQPSAPVEKGETIGRLIVRLDGVTLCDSAIVCDRGIAEDTFAYRLRMLIKMWIGSLS
jgi:D-alanyl-D-alanine carboxypeptidase (penicillin-binding protein 5/6)